MRSLSARGQRLADRYELERELTADSQALEWQARDMALDRRVVVRLLHPELASDPTAAERFWQAARAAARTGGVDEPRILDGGTDAATGQLFVVREWRDEPGLDDLEALAKGAESVPVAVGADVGVPWRRTGVRALAGWPVARRHVVVLGLVLALAVAGALVGASASAWLAWINEPLGRPAQSLSLPPAVGAQAGQATGAAATPLATRAAAARPLAAEATPMPTASDSRAAGEPPVPAATDISAGGEPRRVVNTDGLGVALRASPGGDRQPGQGYAEGAVVTVFEQQGGWARIRGADGREGWVLAVTLAPTDGTAPVRSGATPATAASGPPTPVVRATPAPAAVPARATPSAAASGRQRVVNTDGQGVALRAGPDGDRLPGKGYAEGTPVTVLERSGPWTHIRGDDGRDGWVPTVTLAPS
jgi:SH3-like domain-containing protein